MFISEQEAKTRLESPDNLVNLKAKSFVDRMLSDNSGPLNSPFTEKQEVINSTPTYNYTAGNKVRPPTENPPEIRTIQTKQKGDVAIPSFIKEIVAADAHFTSAREAGQQFNVPASTAARLKNTVDINDRLTTVRDTALDKVMMSLNLLDHNKVSKCNAKDISTIASNVSKVMEKATPQVQASNQVQIIIYSPNQKTEDAYETITVHDVKGESHVKS